MKKTNYLNIALLGAGLLIATSCSSDDFAPETGGEQIEETDNGYVSMTLNVKTEDAMMLSRSRETTELRESYISNAGKIDKLIYAVYEKNEVSYSLVRLPFSEKDKPQNYDSDKGQFTIASSDANFSKLKSSEGLDIKIDSLQRGRIYRVAFWAQNSSTNAYTVTDLQNITVDYSQAKNNDELRDAFCAATGDIRILMQDVNMTNPVILRRPFAQINVGTTGADYRNVIVNEKIIPRTKYTYSSIKLKGGVASTLNVVTNGVGGTQEEPVTFSMAPIASYINIENNAIPSDISELIRGINDEVWLKVELNNEEGYKGYKTSYPTMSYDGKYLTETFKYLSMCYVLVLGNVIDEVTVAFGTKPEDTGISAVTLNNVPVQHNWRTNILGGLRYQKDQNGTDPDDPTPDPTDPTIPDPDDPDNPQPNPDYPYPPTPPTPPGGEDPDPNDPDPTIPEGPDPGSMFNMVSVIINLDPIYVNDYNGFGQAGTTVTGPVGTLDWIEKTKTK